GIFFFSSRRRHTSFSRDWSSDVCSSDLGLVLKTVGPAQGVLLGYAGDGEGLARKTRQQDVVGRDFPRLDLGDVAVDLVIVAREEIGRASCREREEMAGGAAGGRPSRAGR